MTGASGMAVGSSATSPPRRYVAYTAAFSCKHTLQQVYEFLTTHLKISREDMRLWKVKDEVCTHTHTCTHVQPQQTYTSQNTSQVPHVSNCVCVFSAELVTA